MEAGVSTATVSRVLAALDGIAGPVRMAWATFVHPPLTAVAQPVEELGPTGAQLLLERLKDPMRLIRQVVLPRRLRIRASCGTCTAMAAEQPVWPKLT
jgi:DNA-binding LacI/PurR family transcriptional regulator